MPAAQMDETPALPPGVAGQMGAAPEKTPFGGVGAMMAKKPGGPPSPDGGGADPVAGFKSAADAVTKVIDNMATMDQEGAQFAARIKQMLLSWSTEATRRGIKGGGAGPAGPPPGPGGPPPGAPPGGAGPGGKPGDSAPKDFPG